MKLRILTSLVMVAACFAGCTSTGTPEQQEAARKLRGKNVAKLERKAWNLGGFLANIVGNIVTTTVTNYASDKLAGYRK